MDLPFGPRYNIGIDVGGTNTDGVLYDCVDKRIVASVKIPTEHASYAKAIDNSLKALTASIDDNGSEVASVNISTTVSTNALLEGKGEPSNLILIGFDRYPHIVSDTQDGERREKLSTPGLWKILQRITGGSSLLYPPCIPLGIPGMKQLQRRYCSQMVRGM